MQAHVIRKCPSWNRVSRMLGEWSRYEHRGEALAPSRAVEIGANLLAVNIAKRSGKKMPGDWKRCHPSQPYQLAAIQERIAASDLVMNANEVAEWEIALN